MTVRTDESLLSKAHRSIIMGVATGGLAQGIDQMMAGSSGTDVTGLTGANISDGSVLHHGPEEGGEMLDRPSAGYLAHASASNGVAIEPVGNDVSEIARSIDKAGTLQIDGHSIEVLDYLPGGDIVQMASGTVDPGQMLMKLAQHGIEQQMAPGGSVPQAEGRKITGEEMPRTSVGENGAENPAGSGSEDVMADGSPDDPMSPNGMTSTTASATGRKARRAPDADENARDLEILGLEHKLDVDTVIQTSDVAQVHTEIHAHGRTLEIETDFEAMKPDNEEERREAADHVEQVARGGRDQVDHDEPGIHIRSKIAAHLDAASKDEGISM